MALSKTLQTFYDKWNENPQLGLDEILDENSDTFRWILNRNGFTTADELRQFLHSKRRVLDAGCGNGRITALLREYSHESTQIVGFDLASADIARKNLAEYHGVFIYQKDLLGDISDLGKFDFIYCQEVLHHIKDPACGFHNLCSLLEDKGEIAIYVYKEKAPVREFVDDYIRGKISNLPYEEAMKVCDQITRFAKCLSELNIKVRIPAVPILDIPEGEYDFQRLIYHFFMKNYWNPSFSFHDNAVINYDWYHPQLNSKHTPDEVKSWFENNQIEIKHICVDFYGITIRGIKK